MTRFVVDASAILHIVGEGIEVSPTHELLAPTLLRSQALSALHEAAHHGTMPVDVARDRLTRLWRMKIRYLGDAVLRRVAWEVADQLHLPSTYDAEYVALTRLQADALVTRNTDLCAHGGSARYARTDRGARVGVGIPRGRSDNARAPSRRSNVAAGWRLMRSHVAACPIAA